MAKTSDVRDLLYAQLKELKGLSDIDVKKPEEVEAAKMKIAIARETSTLAGRFTDLAKAELAAIKVFDDVGMLPESIDAATVTPSRNHLRIAGGK